MTTPRSILQTWKTHDVPEEYRDYVSSIKANHPDYTYTLLDDLEVDELVKTVTPEYYEAFRNFRRHIERVDFVRYVWLWKFGGVYLDLDIQCLKPLDTLVAQNQIILAPEASEHCKMYMRRADQGVLCNAAMISPPGMQFWKDLMDYIIAHYDDAPWWDIAGLTDNPVTKTGPMALTRFYEDTWNRDKYNIRVLSSCAFFPMSDWHNEGRTMDGIPSITNDCQDLSETYLVHRWGHSWCGDKSVWLIRQLNNGNATRFACAAGLCGLLLWLALRRRPTQ